MTECKSNEEEKEKDNNIPRNLYEKIGSDCQPENVMSFLKSIKVEKTFNKRNTNK